MTVYTNPPPTKAQLDEIIANADAQQTISADILTEAETSNENLEDIKASVADSSDCEIFNVTMTNADTEYSRALPNGCKAFSISVQGGSADKVLRCAFVTGKVATPTAPFYQIPASAEWYEHDINLVGKTLYFACSEAAKVAQILAWV